MQVVRTLLNKAINLEVNAMYSYALQSLVVKHNGYNKLADHYKEEECEEKEHFKLVAARQVQMGYTDMDLTLEKNKTKWKDNAEEYINDNEKSEIEAVALYKLIIEEANKASDPVTAIIAGRILEQEEESLGWIKQQKAAINKGKEAWLKSQV